MVACLLKAARTWGSFATGHFAVAQANGATHGSTDSSSKVSSDARTKKESPTESAASAGAAPHQQQRQTNGAVKEFPWRLRRRPSAEIISPRRGYVFMLLLALQFGLQPLVQKSCINREEVNRVSLVMATELTKVAICLSVMISSGFLADIQSSWTLKSSMKAAALPAALYALQNWLIQIAYMNLDSLTYNLLNQTKTLSAALCLYVVMGRRQSGPQMVALAMLVAAALLLNSRTASDKDGAPGISWELGIVPVMGASLLSGFSAAVTQKSLQERGRNSYLLSAELGLYGIVTLLVTTLAAEGGVQMLRDGLWRGWTPWTCLPVFTQAAGGVVVGQVTKHAGSVKKGFALVGGILVTAAAQYVLEREPLSPEHYVSAVLVALSTVLHARYPYVPKAKVR